MVCFSRDIILFILDISNPENPVQIGHYLNEEMNNITSVVLSRDETKAYLSNMWDNNGLVILDISNPANPKEISYVETVGYANQVVISKDETKAYIADRTTGLTVIDIKNPNQPKKVGYYGSYYVNKLALSPDETKAFLAVPSKGLVIVDITDSTNIQKVSEYKAFQKSSSNIGVSEDGKKVFLSNGTMGMIVIDISDIHNPKELMHYTMADVATDVALFNDGKVLVSDDTNGLFMFDLELFSKVQNHPRVLVVNETKQSNEHAIVMSPGGSRILLNGSDTGLVSPETGKTILILDTSGENGDKTFDISFINIEGLESDTTTITIKKDSTPEVISYVPLETNEENISVVVSGEVGAVMMVNGVEIAVIPSNGQVEIVLDTRGIDGVKSFELASLGESGIESDIFLVSVVRDTTPPYKPTLTEDPPSKTYQDQIEVEVNGEVNSTIIVNGVIATLISSSAKERVVLDTSREEGNKTFEILLVDNVGNESETLNITIKKELIEKSSQDSDNDYIPDAVEVLIGSNPNNSDENENNVLDGLESSGVLGDTFFDEQWHLRNLTNLGNDMGLLDIYHRYMGYNRGNPIIVQVVDNGVDADHEDLTQNMDLSRSYYHSSSGIVVGDPSSQSNNTHGTMVAGIIGARAFNRVGVRGIAPFAKIAGSNYLDGSSIEALEYVWLTGEGANEVAISNNSWGHYLHNDPDNNDAYESIMKIGSETLRDGKGRVYVTSAGNDRASGDNTNLDYMTNNRFMITVAGVGENHKVTSYSNPGGSVLVSGYTGNIGTTTNIGMGGSQTWEADEFKNYTNSMSGTSAAAPMVSASVALVLEACPELGWRDVRYLLVKHAKRVDESNENWVQNSAGLWYSPDYGYGLVNPQGMIDDCNSSYVNLPQEKSFETYGDINFTLEDEQAVTLGGLDVDENMTIEWVELSIDASHSRASDYQVELISPAGTVMNVIEPTSIEGDWMNNGYRLGSAGFVDENSLGSWQVKISDFDVTGEKLSGTIKNLKLKVYGH